MQRQPSLLSLGMNFVASYGPLLRARQRVGIYSGVVPRAIWETPLRAEAFFAIAATQGSFGGRDFEGTLLQDSSSRKG